MIDKQQRNHFDKKNSRYDIKLLVSPPAHTYEETQKLVSILKHNNISRVVELGSGNGRLTIPLLQTGVRVSAVDISRHSLNELVRTAHRLKLPQRLLSVFEAIPSAKTHAFVGCDILHHINLDEYLKIMKKRLTNDGKIIFSEPNIMNFAWVFLITFFIDWRIEWRIIFCNYFTLRKLLKRHGYINIQLNGLGIIPPPLLNRFPLLQKINYFMGDLPLIKIFAYRFIITASN